MTKEKTDWVDVKRRLKKYWALYVLAIIPVVYLIVFRYWPIVLQFVLSTRKYNITKGIWDSEFIGLQNFTDLFGSRDFGRLLFNTVRISVLRLIFGFFPPLILAILLFDMGSAKVRKFSQTVLYIPYFFSWVVVYGLAMVMFQNTGYINNILEAIGLERQNFLMGSSGFLPVLIGTGAWKNLGWSTIIYLATLAGISPELYEAAKLDGAGPLQRIRYITLPGMKSIVIFVLIMNLGKLLSSAGTEQILLFYNPSNYNVSDVIGTWVYRMGIGKLQYAQAAVMSIFESTVGLVLVLVANKLARKWAGRGLW